MTLSDIAQKVRKGEGEFEAYDWIFIKDHPSYFSSDTDCKIMSVEDPWCSESNQEVDDLITEGYSTKFDHEELINYPFQLRQTGEPDSDSTFCQMISHLALFNFWPIWIPQMDLRPIPDFKSILSTIEDMDSIRTNLIQENINYYKYLDRSNGFTRDGNNFASHFTSVCKLAESPYNFHEYAYLRWKHPGKISASTVGIKFSSCPRCGEDTLAGRVCPRCI